MRMSTVTVNGISAHVSEAGDGEPVVLLHSGAGEGRDWRRLVAELPAGYRSAALDFYGCGRTPPWPGPAALTIDDQAHLAATVACSIGTPVHVCGHSYGGAVALRMAVTHPGLVRTLSLVEPQCYPLMRETGDPLFEVSESAWNSFCVALARGEPERGWRQFIDYYSGSGFWDRLRPETRAGFVASSPVERWTVLFSNPTTIDDVRRLQAPTLVLCGEGTTAPERRMCELIAETAPRATLAMLPGAGHMAPITHPKEVAARIAAHISKDRKPAPG
jgi:pimeloyl-ACP methyl ester carboxylesterase